MLNNSISSIISNLNLSETSNTTSTSQSSEFRDLLTALLLSSFSTQDQSDTTSSGLGFQQLLAPLMLNLLEKLFSQNIDDQSSITENTAPDTTPINTPSGKPVNGVLTQGSHAGHIALDFGVPIGTPVKATMDGKVVYAGWNNEGYGNLVIVKNGPYRTYFAHLSKFTVKVGDTVKAGQKVALSGSTGNSTGPHVHYEVRKNGNQIDPTSFTLK
jgi:murein DD-endopeptidase MepM/ murein hydrolase activator NlpD